MQILRTLRTYVWVIALAGALALSIAAIPSIVSLPGDNEVTGVSGPGSFMMTPTNVYFVGNSYSYVAVDIYANLTTPFTGSATAYETSNGSSIGMTLLGSVSVTNSSYFILSFPSISLSHGKGEILVYLGSRLAASLPISLEPEIAPVLLEVSAVAIPVLYAVGIWLAPLRPKWMIACAIPFYVVLAAFFGHRYDMFFMISSGIRVLSHVNPYVPSALLPVSMKWVYPPLFVGYSGLSAIAYHLITGNPVPTSGSLGLPAAMVGEPTDIWRAIVSPQLPVYYLLIKIPMVAAALGSFYLLKEKFRIKGAEKLWLLNPFILLMGAAWGQLDIMASFCLVLSIVYLRAGNTFAAAATASLGAAIKIFPAFILPFILIVSRNKLRDSLPVVFFSALSLAIYAYSGNVGLDVTNLLFTNAQPHLVGDFVTNGITWQQFLPFPHFPPLLIYVFVPFYLYEIVQFWRLRRDVVQILIETFLVFYLTSNFVNPQYFVYIVALFVINQDIKWALIFSAVPSLWILLTGTLTYYVSPYLSYDYASSLMGQGEQLQTTLVGSSHVVILAVLAVTALLLYRYWCTKGFDILAEDLRRVFKVRKDPS